LQKFSEGIEYEIAEITEVRKYKLSSITKTQGYTTTGDMFFLFTSSDFEKVMFLTRGGEWQKAEMREKFTVPDAPKYVEPEPTIQMFTWMNDPILIGEDLTINVKVTDDKSNRGLLTSGGGIYGADITIITAQNGNTLLTDKGKTGYYGTYYGGINLLSGIYEYSDYLDITIIAQWHDQYISEQHRVWITVSEGS